MSQPWMPFYVADYLADTGHLTTIEHGAYLLLIMHYWRHEGLPEDQSSRASIVRMAPREWAKIETKIGALFQGWKHKRIDAELAKAKLKSEARASAGQRGGLSNGRRDKSKPEAIASNLLDQISTDAEASSSQPQSQVQAGPDIPFLQPEKKPEILSVPALPETDARKNSSKKSRNTYPAAFEELWGAYPTDANMSKAKAFVRWRALSPADKELALKSCGPYRAYCADHAKNNYRPKHLEGYLNDRRFVGHAETAVRVVAAQGVFVRIGTPQWRAWDEYFRRQGKVGCQINKEGTGWWFKSEWPPGLTEAA